MKTKLALAVFALLLMAGGLYYIVALPGAPETTVDIAAEPAPAVADAPIVEDVAVVEEAPAVADEAAAPAPTVAEVPVPTTSGSEADVADTTRNDPVAQFAVVDGDTVVADARVVPLESAELSFPASGKIAEILVDEGQTVEAGQVLARLDRRQLELSLEQARAVLAQEQANLARAQSSVTEKDIAAAEADLAEARIRLAELEALPRPTDVRSARAALDRAQVNLQRVRDDLSTNKNNAQLTLEQTADRLRIQQEKYSVLYWENRNKADLEPDDIAEENEALRLVEIAEADLEQARMEFELAQQAEINGIREAETRVVEAQSNLEEVLLGADKDALAAARSAIARAETNLDRLTGAARQADLNSAQARLTQRQSDLRQAELALENAALIAPIAGTVAYVNFLPGQEVRAGNVVIGMADLANWRLETADLVELDVVRIKEGASVAITFDALPNVELSGTVSLISPVGSRESGQTYTTYRVYIQPDTWDSRLRWNMTATVTIDTR